MNNSFTGILKKKCVAYLKVFFYGTCFVEAEEQQIMSE
jgi:hypothetical protein